MLLNDTAKAYLEKIKATYKIERQLTEMTDIQLSLIQMTQMIGYKHDFTFVYNENGSLRGLVIAQKDGDRHFNNGVYLLIRQELGNVKIKNQMVVPLQAEDEAHPETEEASEFLQEVLSPNTLSRQPIIDASVEKLVKTVEKLDPYLQPFDIMEIMLRVIDQSIVNGLAETFFGSSLQKKEGELTFDPRLDYFKQLYMPRFLQTMNQFYMGNAPEKEFINSEPFLLKQTLEQGTISENELIKLQELIDNRFKETGDKK